MSSETGKTYHPSAEMLTAWADQQLEAKAAERLEQHFESCTSCRELAEDLRAFDQLGAAEELDEEDVEKSLGELRRRVLVAEAEKAAFAEPHQTESNLEDAVILPFVAAPTSRQAPLRPEGLGRRSFFSAWAAAALVALVGGGVAFERQQEVTRLSEKVAALDAANAELKADLKRPLANPAILELKPESGPLRGGDDSVPYGEALTVVLQSNMTFPSGPWHATISIGGNSALEIEDLKPVAGALYFFLPPEALEPGEYQIRLTYEDGEKTWPEVFPLPLGR